MATALTKEDINRLAVLRTQIKELNKEHEDLCNRLKKIMEKEERDVYAAGPKSPFQLKLSRSTRTCISWKDECMRLLKKMYGKKWKKGLKNIEDAADETPIVSLLIEPNPEYKKKSA